MFVSRTMSWDIACNSLIPDFIVMPSTADSIYKYCDLAQYATYILTGIAMLCSISISFQIESVVNNDWFKKYYKITSLVMIAAVTILLIFISVNTLRLVSFKSNLTTLIKKNCSTDDVTQNLLILSKKVSSTAIFLSNSSEVNR